MMHLIFLSDLVAQLNIISMNINLLFNKDESLSKDELIELALDELFSVAKEKGVEVDVIFLISSREHIKIFEDKLKNRSRIIYVGRVPININSLLSFLMINSAIEDNSIFYFEFNLEDFKLEQLETCFIDEKSILLKALKHYFHRDTSTTDLVQIVSTILENKVDKTISFDLLDKSIDVINCSVEFDTLIVNLFEFKFASCNYGSLDKDLFKAIRNKTVNEHVYDKVKLSSNKSIRWRGLLDVFDEYSNFAIKSDLSAMIFYVALFFNASIFYKKSKSSLLCYICLLRCYETLISYGLLKRGALSNHNGLAFSVDKNPVSGVGCLVRFITDAKIINIEESRCIYKLVEIRNRAILGHGFNLPSLDLYDECHSMFRVLKSKFITEDYEIDFFERCRLYLNVTKGTEILKELEPYTI
ncbi:hypothetical protein [Aeromonas veronii]|uniref:hypothetical protein n=1 Tax=Aeromonas veronii TaxID=654 RepID=UPI002B4759A8|nr:hypothetical protein [Aeromonas veronii]